MSGAAISEIVSFWLGPSLDSPDAASARRDWWYKGGAPVDAEIGARFRTLVSEASQGSLTHWQRTPKGALALILLLDQFTRNLYRNTPDAYVGDPTAFEIVNQAIDAERDRQLPPVARYGSTTRFITPRGLKSKKEGSRC